MANQPETSLYIHGSDPVEQARLSRLNEWLNRSCLNAMSLTPDTLRLLDVGSGLGQFTRTMAEALPQEAFILGVERDPQQLNKAIQLANQDSAAQKVVFRQGEATSLPLETSEWGNFDLAHTRFVLEHVRRPELIVRQMVAAVRPGGRIVLMDDDHANFRLSPEPPGFSVIWEAYLRSYERLGNDPFVGRRLVSLLKNEGLHDIQTDLIFFGGSAEQAIFPVVASNLLGILIGSKSLMLEEGLLDERTFDRCIAQIDDWRNLPDAVLWYGLNYADGKKPL